MRRMTAAEYAEHGGGPRLERRRCPNPTCRDGFDTDKDVGREVRGYNFLPCTVCGALGEVLVEAAE